MATKRELLLRRHLQFNDGGVIAEIFIRPGQPYRKLVNGRRVIPVGRLNAVKSGMKAQEWESIRCELQMIELCEVATPVHSIQSQPHGLYMKVAGRLKRLEYIPDLELQVDMGFALKVAAGEPFATAVKYWHPGKHGPLATMVVEVKDDDDPRNDDVDYQDKLRLAKQVYQGLGRFFVTVFRTRDLEAANIARAVHEILLDHTVSVGAQDIEAVSKLFQKAGVPVETVPLSSICNALGIGPQGSSKASALHVRRVISIELDSGLAPHTAVRLVQDRRAIFERRGAR
jgi:hypothetical protein